MVDSDVKGHDWNAQLKLGSPSFVGLNYFQSVTPHLSAGGEFFWLQVGDGVWDPDQATLMCEGSSSLSRSVSSNLQPQLGYPHLICFSPFPHPHSPHPPPFLSLQSSLKSGVGLAVRHTGEKHVGTLQLATTGIMSMGYAHRVSEKITLASDFLWHWQSREATATVCACGGGSVFGSMLHFCRMLRKCVGCQIRWVVWICRICRIFFCLWDATFLQGWCHADPACSLRTVPAGWL